MKCSFCDAPTTHGYSGGYTGGNNYVNYCYTCGVYVCSDEKCSRNWMSFADNQYKICRDCLEAGMKQPSSSEEDEWKKKYDKATRHEKSETCISCNSHIPHEEYLNRTAERCHSCNEMHCSSCVPNGQRVDVDIYTTNLFYCDHCYDKREKGSKKCPDCNSINYPYSENMHRNKKLEIREDYFEDKKCYYCAKPGCYKCRIEGSVVKKGEIIYCKNCENKHREATRNAVRSNMIISSQSSATEETFIDKIKNIFGF